MNILKNITALLLTLLFLWLFGFAGFAAYSVFAGPQAPQEKTDAIVVLTGGNNRIEEGLRLYSERKARHMFISGVYKDVTKDQITSLWTEKTPLPACCLTLGYKATTTEENAIETREWIEENNIRTIRLVTGNYHMIRSLVEFHHMAPGVKISIHPVWQADLGIKTARFWTLLLVEYHKTLYRSLQLLLS